MGKNKNVFTELPPQESYSNKKPKVYFEHFGCRLNRSETAVMAQGRDNEYETVTDQEAADFIVINTCTVTNRADQKNRSAIRRAKKFNPGAYIIVTGCYASTDAESLLQMDEVGAVLGNKEKFRLPNLLNGKVSHDIPPIDAIHFPMARQSTEFNARAFLKVQDGCNCRCSYCKIPYARGKAVSREAESAMTETAIMVQDGFREIVLTGVNLGLYKNPESGFSGGLSEFIENLTHIEGSFLIRLSSLEPQFVTPRLLNLFVPNPETGRPTSGKKLARYLHLPVQSGSNSILQLMNRDYTREEYIEKIELIRLHNPEAHIGTDIIVGFPGETEEDFEETLALVERCRFANIHVFPFSRRSGVAIDKKLNEAGSKLRLVDKETKRERVSRLTQIKDRLAAEYMEETAGQTFYGIVEKIPSEKDEAEHNEGEHNEGELNEAEIVSENYLKLKTKGNGMPLKRGGLVLLSYDGGGKITRLENVE